MKCVYTFYSFSAQKVKKKINFYSVLNLDAMLLQELRAEPSPVPYLLQEEFLLTLGTPSLL